MAKTMKVKLSELKKTFYVRTQLNQDHVIKLADLYSAGMDIEKIKISPSKEIIDGRHRSEAMELAFNPNYEIEAEVVSITDPIEAIAFALRANEGGSLPSSTADTVHTIRLMMNQGASERAIYEKLSFFPRPYVRKYLEEAKKKIKKGLLQQAKEAVASGDTVREAAEKYGIDIKELKAAIAGPKIGSDSTGTQKMMSTISNKFFTLNRGNQAMVKRLVVGFSDGDVNEKVVEAVLDHIEDLLKKANRRLADWRSRFDAAKAGRLFSWKDIAKEEDEAKIA
jgi:uncharacterized protein YfiM (DUF2279 family)